jgi:hypothetical protein
MPATPQLTARVEPALLDAARTAAGEPAAAAPRLVRAGLYALMMVTPEQAREAMRLAARRKGWPVRDEVPDGDEG